MRTLYWLGLGVRTAALCQGSWKLLVNQPGADERTELYQLGSDPFEKEDISGNHPERVAELRKRLAAEIQCDSDTVSQAND